MPYVNSDGARNLNKISKELSLPYQTLRFRMLHLKDLGISVTPIVDTRKIGLERVRATFKFADPEMRGNVDPFFGGLHQSAGLRYYSRSLLTHDFDCEFNVPDGSSGELLRLFRKLEEMGVIGDFQLHRLLWKDILMLKTQFFDYSRGEWDVNFSDLAGDPSVSVPSTTEPEKFDYADLLIAKELQLNSWIKAVDLAKKIGIPERDVAYHMNKHVLGKKLIPCFRFRWVGTREAWSKHTIIGMTFVFEDISSENTRHAMSIFTSNPFTWCHMRSVEGMYMAESLIPTTHLPETTQYLSTQLRNLGLSPSESWLPDWNCANNYTIPYTLYDKESENWKFNAEKAVEYTLQMVKTYAR